MFTDTNPEEVFKCAQAAVGRKDWKSFFLLLDEKDLMRIAKNAFNMSFKLHQGSNKDFDGICKKYQLSIDTIREYYAKQEWKAYDNHLLKVLRSLADLSGLTADLEQHTRSVCGGGSISSSLFEGEHLEYIKIEGKTARATRIIGDNYSLPVGFVKKNEKWYIKLIVRDRK